MRLLGANTASVRGISCIMSGKLYNLAVRSRAENALPSPLGSLCLVGWSRAWRDGREPARPGSIEPVFAVPISALFYGVFLDLEWWLHRGS